MKKILSYFRSAVSPEKNELSVLLYQQTDTLSEELAWGQKLCEDFLRHATSSELLTVRQRNDVFPIVAEALEATHSSQIGVVMDDQVFWSPIGWSTLRKVLDENAHVAAVSPVSNFASVDGQKVFPPFLYSTPSTLRLAAHEQY